MVSSAPDVGSNSISFSANQRSSRTKVADVVVASLAGDDAADGQPDQIVWVRTVVTRHRPQQQ